MEVRQAILMIVCLYLLGAVAAMKFTDSRAREKLLGPQNGIINWQKVKRVTD